MPAQYRTAAIALAAVVAASCSQGREPGKADAQPPVEVAVQAARVESQARTFEVGGVVQARNTATLVSRIFADVQDVVARPGDRVRAGQVLIRLDGRDLQANRARAEAGLAAADQAVVAATSGRDAAGAGLALATATHRRLAELRSKNSATPNEFDQAVSGLHAAQSQFDGAEAGIRQAKAGAEAARAALEAAKVGASYAAITAPFDGVVTEKRVEVGNMATPGAPLMVIEDARSFRLEVRLDESRVAGLDRTRPVPVVIDSLNQGGAASGTQVGRIAEVARALDPGSHAFLLKIDLPDGASLTSGMFGRARFSGAARQALVVPPSAIVRRGQLTEVFVAGADNRARVRLVQLGTTDESRAEVVAGLDAGESVVVSPTPAIVDGRPVRVTGSSAANGPAAAVQGGVR